MEQFWIEHKQEKQLLATEFYQKWKNREETYNTHNTKPNKYCGCVLEENPAFAIKSSHHSKTDILSCQVIV